MNKTKYPEQRFKLDKKKSGLDYFDAFFFFSCWMESSAIMFVVGGLSLVFAIMLSVWAYFGVING